MSAPTTYYGTDWVNAAAPAFGADPTGTADSAPAIQSALNTGQNVYLPVGNYVISQALTVNSGQSLIGAGQYLTTIRQTRSTANGIEGTDVEYVTLRDFTVKGPGTGSGNGVYLTRSADPNIPYCSFVNVTVQDFGNVGFYGNVLIVSRFAGCIAASNGGDGFQFNSPVGNTTSIALDACYANGNTGTGYEFDSAVYCSLSGCAADSNGGGGYALYTSHSVTLSGCGAESNTTFSVLLSGGTGNTVSGLWVNNNGGIGIHVTAGEANATLTGCAQSGGATGTAFIQTDSGTSAVVINDTHTTANSFASGTAYEILYSGGTTH